MAKTKANRSAVSTDLGKLFETIKRMSPRELQALRKEFEGLTESNCWWVMYHARHLVIELIDAARENAKYRRKKARQMSGTKAVRP